MSEMDIASIAAAQQQAQGAENRRRELAAQRPGHGAQIELPQPPSAAAIGKSGLDLPIVGEGYGTPPEPSPFVQAAYSVPNYADAVVGGVGFQAGRNEPAVRVLLRARAAAPGGIAVVSPDVRPSLWRRLLRRGHS
jgi:hypothetical protein